MKYLSGETDNLSIQVTAVATDCWAFDNPVAPERVRNAVTHSDSVEMKRTSRSEWPSKRLVGEKIETGSETIKLYTQKVEIKYQHGDFTGTYNILTDALTDGQLSPPDRDSFCVESLLITTNRNSDGVYIDESKLEQAEFAGYTTEVLGMNVTLFQNDEWCLVYIDDNPIQTSSVDDLLDKLTDSNLLYTSETPAEA